MKMTLSKLIGKLILPLALLACSLLAAQAQTTNILIRLTYIDSGTTNVQNASLGQGYIQGFMLAWQRDRVAALQQTNGTAALPFTSTNLPPVWFSITNEFAALIQPLKQRADADEILTNDVPNRIQNLQAYWSAANATKKSNFVQALIQLSQ